MIVACSIVLGILFVLVVGLVFRVSDLDDSVQNLKEIVWVMIDRCTPASATMTPSHSPSPSAGPDEDCTESQNPLEEKTKGKTKS